MTSLLKKTIVILGATGSIGQQAIKVAKKLKYKIVGISFNSNISLGLKLVKKLKIKNFICNSDTKMGNCINYKQLLELSKPDIVINAISGANGLQATISCLDADIKEIALANKESIVLAGKFIMEIAKKKNIKIIPVDSEHTSLLYLLGNCQEKISNLYITGSGGKFYKWTINQLKNVSFEQAITHKNWSMGKKITVDSNTLMNKCFELIEAYWYFKTKNIEVLLNDNSYIHAAIMTKKGNFSYFCSKPNMQQFIKLAITDFSSKIKFAQKNNFLLEQFDKNILPIKWAYKAINDKTNSFSIALCCLDEFFVNLFLNKKIEFWQIILLINKTLAKCKSKKINSIKEVFNYVEYTNKILKKIEYN